MKELPQRKPTRLKGFDYSQSNAYFVTICTHKRLPLFAEITTATNTCNTVGEGLAPPEYKTKLKPCGEIAKKQLELIEKRYPSVKLLDYTIMPDHIHAILFFQSPTGGASPSPTLSSVICSFKSLTTVDCKKLYGIEKLFQRSFAEHVIRDDADYQTRRNYLYENAGRWYYKHIDNTKKD